jgi:hypothetical protein
MAMLGMVVAFVGPEEKIPEGWMLCAGQALARQGKFEPLFKVIGTLHGVGDNVTTFNLPDFRGYFLRGVSGASGVDPDVDSRSPAAGHKQNEVGSRQSFATALPHAAFTNEASGAHFHQDPTWNGQPGPYELAVEYRGPGGHDYGPQSAPTSVCEPHSHKIVGGDRETRPVNKYVHWLICVQ